MNLMADQISNLSDEDQQRFHEGVQQSNRRRWRAKVRERTEREQDEKDKRRTQ